MKTVILNGAAYRLSPLQRADYLEFERWRRKKKIKLKKATPAQILRGAVKLLHLRLRHAYPTLTEAEVATGMVNVKTCEINEAALRAAGMT